MTPRSKPSVAVPPLRKPPPPKRAELPVKVLPVTITVPSLLSPPPPRKAELLENTQSLTVKVPELSRPPPVLLALPPAIVRPEMRTVFPASTVKTRKLGVAGLESRRTVVLLAPRPLMVISRFKSGRAVFRVIVPGLTMLMM